MLYYALIFISISLLSLGIIFLFKGGLFKSKFEFADVQLELNDLQKVVQANRKTAQDIKRRIEEDKVKFCLEK